MNFVSGKLHLESATKINARKLFILSNSFTLLPVRFIKGLLCSNFYYFKILTD